MDGAARCYRTYSSLGPVKTQVHVSPIASSWFAKDAQFTEGPKLLGRLGIASTAGFPMTALEIKGYTKSLDLLSNELDWCS